MNSKLTQRPWFVPIIGVLALGAQAWLESPVEMVVFGLPFFVVVVGGLMLARTLSTDAGTPAPGSRSASHGFGGKFVAAALFAILVVGFAYIVWGRLRDTGLVGWLDAAQARRGGKYSERLSFVTAVFYLLILFGGGIGLLLKFRGRTTSSPTSAVAASLPAARPAVAPTAGPRAGGISHWWILIGLIGAIWIVGLGIYEYGANQHRQAMRATYEPVDVSQPRRAGGQMAFVALNGKMHPSGYVLLSQGSQSTKTFFVPLTALSAPSDSPVHWIVELYGDSLPALEVPVYAHDGGRALPRSARDALERIGARLAADAVVVEHVPTLAGVVLNRSKEDRELFVGVAGLLTVMIMIVWAIAAVLRLRLRRKKARNCS